MTCITIRPFIIIQFSGAGDGEFSSGISRIESIVATFSSIHNIPDIFDLCFDLIEFMLVFLQVSKCCGQLLLHFRDTTFTEDAFTVAASVFIRAVVDDIIDR